MTKALGIDLGTGGLDAAAPIYSKKKKKKKKKTCPILAEKHNDSQYVCLESMPRFLVMIRLKTLK